jgi:hypothetical protein
MTENGLDVSDGYVLIKNGYFWRPNAAGYTSHLADAGIYSDEESRLRCANPDVTRERYVDALARRLPPADNAVAWKGLEWRYTEDSPRHQFYAESLIGTYRIEHIGGGWRAYFKGVCIDNGEHWNREGLAQDFCQADYETRIRSALEPTPSYAEGRAAATDAQKLAKWHSDTADLKLKASINTLSVADKINLDNEATFHRKAAEIIEALIGAAL